ncbi:hypothetical protein OG799_24245 [Micromonospora sp. NBC_00898]|nr:hypothetical protein OG799_24245 [Micromonospora sp. NBC_00898]
MSFRAAVEAEGLFAAIGVVSGAYSGPRAVDMGHSWPGAVRGAAASGCCRACSA